MKKIISLLFTGIMITFVLASCADNQTTAEPADSTLGSVSYEHIEDNNNEDAFETKTYTHTALEGAVIAKQDGSGKVTYYEHCESCGKTFSNVKKNVTLSGTGVYTSGFNCPECGNSQSVRIETTKK